MMASELYKLTILHGWVVAIRIKQLGLALGSRSAVQMVEQVAGCSLLPGSLSPNLTHSCSASNGRALRKGRNESVLQ